LEQEAFLQVAGANAGWVEVLNFFNQFFYFFGAGVYVLAEGEVIAYRGCFAAQVAVVIYAADDLFCYFLGAFIEV
jgi:hypothetical protein